MDILYYDIHKSGTFHVDIHEIIQVLWTFCFSMVSNKEMSSPSIRQNSSNSPGRPIIVCASGYFSALHRGHVEYLERSKALGDILIVIVNNDEQTLLKHGKIFKSIEDRLEVIRSLRCVDVAIVSVDSDRSVCKTLASVRPHIFTNAGDQTNDNIPEKEICDRYHIKMVDGLGEKVQSSSWILAEYCSKSETE